MTDNNSLEQQTKTFRDIIIDADKMLMEDNEKGYLEALNKTWVPSETAEMAVKEARLEVTKIDADNIIWWKTKYENSQADLEKAKIVHQVLQDWSKGLAKRLGEKNRQIEEARKIVEDFESGIYSNIKHLREVLSVVPKPIVDAKPLEEEK
jgi:hypothetical protein